LDLKIDPFLKMPWFFEDFMGAAQSAAVFWRADTSCFPVPFFRVARSLAWTLPLVISLVATRNARSFLSNSASD
jgi:hypothetical protein